MKLKKSVIFLTALTYLGGVASTVKALPPNMNHDQQEAYNNAIRDLSEAKRQFLDKVLEEAYNRGELYRATPERIELAHNHLINQPDVVVQANIGNVSAILDQIITSVQNGTLDPTAVAELCVVFRTRKEKNRNKEHLFTINSFEVADAVGKLNHVFECVAFTRNPDGVGQEIFRLYNKNADQHHYTADTNERDDLVKKGWVWEKGSGFFIKKAETDEALVRRRGPIPGVAYRLYNKLNGGEHMFTQNWNEVVEAEKLGWVYEGIAFYVN